MHCDAVALKQHPSFVKWAVRISYWFPKIEKYIYLVNGLLLIYESFCALYKTILVPSWADACIIRGIPGLVMQYIADTASIELIRNCEAEGFIRQTCRGKQVWSYIFKFINVWKFTTNIKIHFKKCIYFRIWVFHDWYKPQSQSVQNHKAMWHIASAALLKIWFMGRITVLTEIQNATRNRSSFDCGV